MGPEPRVGASRPGATGQRPVHKQRFWEKRCKPGPAGILYTPLAVNFCGKRRLFIELLRTRGVRATSNVLYRTYVVVFDLSVNQATTWGHRPRPDAEAISQPGRPAGFTVSLRGPETRPISLLTFAAALSSFMVLSYVICVIGYLLLPDWLMIPHNSLELSLPGFKLLTLGSFVLGVLEVLIFGWYVALVFGVRSIISMLQN